MPDCKTCHNFYRSYSDCKSHYKPKYEWNKCLEISRHKEFVDDGCEIRTKDECLVCNEEEDWKMDKDGNCYDAYGISLKTVKKLNFL